MRRCSRRAALRCTALVAGVSLAGCQGDDPTGAPTRTGTGTPGVVVDPAGLPGAVRPAGDPPAVPDPLTCDEDSFTRFGLSAWADRVVWGTSPADGPPRFALRTSDLAVERGDDLTVTPTNLRATPAETGHRDLYTVEAYTTDGWQEVRGWRRGTPRPYPTVEVSHDPRSGFEWQLTPADGGLSRGHVHEEALTVCPGLPAGRYRFVYRGIRPAVAVAFDVTG